MAISLNGSSQYVTLGNGVDVYRTRPFTICALIDSASLRTSGAWNGVICEGKYATNGWFVEIEAAATPRLSFEWNNADSTRSAQGMNLAANTGWWLIAVVMRDAGTSTTIDFFGYRYSNSTLTVSSVTGKTDDDPSAPTATFPTVVGAWVDNTATIADFFPGTIGWAAVFAGDLGESGSSGAKAIWELIVRGPVGMLDSNCKLFIPFPDAAQDWSGNGWHGTLVASPSYAGSGPTEFMALGAIVVTRNAPAGSIVIELTASAGAAGVIDPAVQLGSIVYAPEALTAAGVVVSPSAVMGGVTYAPAALTTAGMTVDPSAQLSAVTYELAALFAAGATVAPAVLLGGVTSEPAAASTTIVATDPAVETSGLVLALAEAIAATNTQETSVILSGLAYELQAAVSAMQAAEPVTLAGDITLILAALEAATLTIDPGAVLSDVALTALVEALATALDIEPIAGPLAIELPASSTALSGIAPGVAYSDVLIELAAALSAAQSIDVTVDVSGITLSPQAAVAAIGVIDPAVLLSDVLVTLIEAACVARAVNASVYLSPVEIVLTEAGASIVTVAPSYLASVGVEPSPASVSVLGQNDPGKTSGIILSPAAARAALVALDATLDLTQGLVIAPAPAVMRAWGILSGIELSPAGVVLHLVGNRTLITLRPRPIRLSVRSRGRS